MDKVLKETTNKIFELLENSSTNYIYLTSTVNKHLLDIKGSTLEERIPSKSLDLILIDEFDNKLISRVSKYLSKFNKYCFLLFNNIESIEKIANNYPKLYINISKSKIIRHYLTYLKLSQSHKEFEKSTTSILNNITENALHLGVIEFSQESVDSFDFVLVFKNLELLNDFKNKLSKLRDKNEIEDFYEHTLTSYAEGIDKRNIRLVTNLKIIHSIILKITNLIKTKTHSLYEKIPKRAKQSVLENNTKIEKKSLIKIPFDNYVRLVKFNLQKLWVEIYKKRIIRTNKQISYDEYINREKSNYIETIKENRNLQKFKINPQISIIMILNDIDEIWLNKSIRTIKEQTYKNWELILIDNCSTRTYIKSYLSSLNDPRVKTYFYNTKKTYSQCLSTGYNISHGEYITVLNEGDELNNKALFYIVQEINNDYTIDYIYSNEDKISEQGKRIKPFIKPKWDKTMICSYPYALNMSIIKRDLAERIDAFKSHTSLDPMWDLLLKLSSLDVNIKHIPLILYHKRIVPLRKVTLDIHPEDALKSYLAKESIHATVHRSENYHGAYYIIKKHSPKVSIILFNNNYLNRFLDTFNINYSNYDINVGTTTDSIHNKFPTRIYKFDQFNFSSASNAIAKEANGEYLLFLDTRLKISNPNFLNILCSYVNEKTIVGTKILDEDGIIQNSFFVKNFENFINIPYEGQQDKNIYETNVTRECSGVSKKCLLIQKDLFLSMKFDPKFKYSYQDIDLCFNATQNGSKIIYAPDASLRSLFKYAPEKLNESDSIYFINKWKGFLKEGDPFLNTNILSSLRLI